MSNIQTGAERMPHDLSHLGFLAGQIGRLITISTTPVIAGDSFEMDAVGALRLSPLRRGLAIRSEERRVGKECRYRWSADDRTKNGLVGGLLVGLVEGQAQELQDKLMLLRRWIAGEG